MKLRYIGFISGKYLQNLPKGDVAAFLDIPNLTQQIAFYKRNVCLIKIFKVCKQKTLRVRGLLFEINQIETMEDPVNKVNHC